MASRLRFRSLPPIVVALLLLAVSAPAQHRQPALVSYRGFVQVFSHAAITVRDPHNRNALRTFSYSPQLQRQLENRHLEYDQPVTVIYRRGDQVAVRIKAKFHAGS